jgi:uncharacterized membrane protein
MMKIEKTIEIEAPVEQVFGYISDPAHTPEYMPSAYKVKDIQRLPDGRYTYTLVNKLLGVHMDFTCEQVEVSANERLIQKMQGTGIDSLMTQRFERLADGKTRLSLVAEINLHAGPLATYGETFFERYFGHGAEMSLEAIKAHVEAKTLSATPS